MKEPNSTLAVRHILEIIKAGLYSKYIIVIQWACRLLIKFATHFNKQGFGGITWEWLVSSSTGNISALNALLSAYQRYGSELLESTLIVICEYGINNVGELFTYYMPMMYQSQALYLRTVSAFIKTLSEQKKYKEIIVGTGIIKYWVDLCVKVTENNSSEASFKTEDRAESLGLLSELWEHFTEQIEETTEIPDQIIKIAQRATRSKSEALQIFAVIQLSHLLEFFIVSKGSYASAIFKTLTFALMENHHKESLKGLILGNFIQLIGAIPINVVAEPYIKQVCLVVNNIE